MSLSSSSGSALDATESRLVYQSPHQSLSNKDTLFAEPRRHVVDFSFDEQVASVFPDMLRRSIPGYETIISMLGVIAAQYAQNNSRIYDLGCSLGAATLSMHSQLRDRPIEYLAVDNSEAMTTRCQTNLAKNLGQDRYRCVQQDVRDIRIENASVVVLNFTLQFLPEDARQQLIRSIFRGLRQGGVLVLSEKVRDENAGRESTLADIYHGFKAGNGYSELEISQKRDALEKVMRINSIEEHLQRYESAGFHQPGVWFRCFNFVSMLGVKPHD